MCLAARNYQQMCFFHTLTGWRFLHSIMSSPDLLAGMEYGRKRRAVHFRKANQMISIYMLNRKNFIKNLLLNLKTKFQSPSFPLKNTSLFQRAHVHGESCQKLIKPKSQNEIPEYFFFFNCTELKYSLGKCWQKHDAGFCCLTLLDCCRTTGDLVIITSPDFLSTVDGIPAYRNEYLKWAACTDVQVGHASLECKVQALGAHPQLA